VTRAAHSLVDWGGDVPAYSRTPSTPSASRSRRLWCFDLSATFHAPFAPNPGDATAYWYKSPSNPTAAASCLQEIENSYCQLGLWTLQPCRRVRYRNGQNSTEVFSIHKYRSFSRITLQNLSIQMTTKRAQGALLGNERNSVYEGYYQVYIFLTRLPFNRRRPTRERVYLVTLVWPWPRDLDTRPWRRCSEVVPTYQYWGFYSSGLSSQSSNRTDIHRQTDRCDLMYYHVAFWGGNKVTNCLNVLDQQTVDGPSASVFKSRLSTITDNRMGFFMDWSVQPLASVVGYVCLVYCLENNKHAVVKRLRRTLTGIAAKMSQ